MVALTEIPILDIRAEADAPLILAILDDVTQDIDALTDAMAGSKNVL